MTTALRKPRCYLTRVERYKPPCMTSPTPELWWSPEKDEDHNSAKIAAVYEQRAQQARFICCTECPLQQQQTCAQYALDGGVESGVWAGVKLSGSAYRHKAAVVEQRKLLQLIADGLGAHELPENAELLEQFDQMAS